MDTVSVVKVPGVITTVTTPEGEIVTTVAGGQRGLTGADGAQGPQGPQGVPGVDGSTDALTLQGQNGAYYKDRDNHTGPSASKATPVDADNAVLLDSAASGVAKKLSWANIKATLKTYFDTIYAPIAGAGAAWGAITGTLSDQADLQSALDGKVKKSGDTMTGDIVMSNPNPTTAGVQVQFAPAIHANGAAWNGSASVGNDVKQSVIPINGPTPGVRVEWQARRGVEPYAPILSYESGYSTSPSATWKFRGFSYGAGWGGDLQVEYNGVFRFLDATGNPSLLVGSSFGNGNSLGYQQYYATTPYRPEICAYFGESIVLRAGRPSDGAGASGTEKVDCQLPLHVPDEAYSTGWNGDTSVPTKNAIFDKIESLAIQSKADAAAANNELYFSTDVSKLSYKDPSGVVNRLY